jgi:Zn-dependent metalloprotease
MVDTLKMRGDENLRKMALHIEKEAEKSRDDRQASAPGTAFMAAPILEETAPTQLQRQIYNASDKSLPGKLVREEGQDPLEDQTVNEAYDGSGDTYKLYFDIYKRNSVDGNGGELVSSVHYGKNYNNAFWNGGQMVYGDGDGTLFRSFTSSLTVIGHELSHGVVQYSGGLIYQDQSGALNESYADVFGCLTEQYKLGQEVHESDWLIGKGLFGPNIQGEALRSMKGPGTAYNDSLIGKDPQPYHMSEYVSTSSDRGGVHINSGIPNHAFYLLAVYLGGKAWEKAGQIWYDTMQAINNPAATFLNWADKTVEMARERYGPGSLEVIYTRRAWKLVGIYV